MECVRYSWAKQNIGELSTSFKAQGFNVIQPDLPKPEIRVGYMERIEVTGEKSKAFLDPYAASITSREQPTEKDSKLRRLIEQQYRHSYPSKRP